MNNPSPSNPSGSGRQQQHHHNPNAVPATPHPPNIHQSHSFSSYHHHSPYYYHAASPYPQQPQVSPMSVQYGAAPHPPHPYGSPYQHHPHHHHGQQQQHGHHSLAAANTPWPAPPPSSSSYAEGEKMDCPTLSPGGGGGGGGLGQQYSPSPSPPVIIGGIPSGGAPAVFADTSALATLANASAASSAGPLKKRRKVGKKEGGSSKDDAVASSSSERRDSESESPASMESSSSAGNNGSSTADGSNELSSNDVAYAQFPSLLHRLLCEESTYDEEDREKDEKKNDEDNDDATATAATSKSAVASAISSAMEWLPHGMGLRVLRWDALCAEVLPKEFPQLCDGVFPPASTDVAKHKEAVDERDDKNDASAATSEENERVFSEEQWIEAFLWHMRAWGFEEVKSGRDRGSFRHELFTRESPERCSEMHRRPINIGRITEVATLPPAPAPRNAEIGHSSSFDVERHQSTVPTPSWSKSHKVVSSIFKPRRRSSGTSSHYHHHHQQHPPHLHVPMLGPSATASFAEAASWGGGISEHHHHHVPRGGSEHRSGMRPHPHHHHHGYPPTHPNHAPQRNPKTIRFRDDPPEVQSPRIHRKEDVAVEITPNPNPAEVSSPLMSRGGQAAPPAGFHRGFVSRRGRRPALISRHSTH